HITGFRGVVGQCGEVLAVPGRARTMVDASRGLEVTEDRDMGLSPPAQWQRSLDGLPYQVVAERQAAPASDEQSARDALVYGRRVRDQRTQRVEVQLVLEQHTSQLEGVASRGGEPRGPGGDGV